MLSRSGVPIANLSPCNTLQSGVGAAGWYFESARLGLSLHLCHHGMDFLVAGCRSSPTARRAAQEQLDFRPAVVLLISALGLGLGLAGFAFQAAQPLLFLGLPLRLFLELQVAIAHTIHFCHAPLLVLLLPAVLLLQFQAAGGGLFLPLARVLSPLVLLGLLHRLAFALSFLENALHAGLALLEQLHIAQAGGLDLFHVLFTLFVFLLLLGQALFFHLFQFLQFDPLQLQQHGKAVQLLALVVQSLLVDWPVARPGRRRSTVLRGHLGNHFLLNISQHVFHILHSLVRRHPLGLLPLHTGRRPGLFISLLDALQVRLGLLQVLLKLPQGAFLFFQSPQPVFCFQLLLQRRSSLLLGRFNHHQSPPKVVAPLCLLPLCFTAHNATTTTDTATAAAATAAGWFGG
eukprot:m.115792 g.115792  ORF g.115792 m.115792 type:complete len:403 (-) comp19409_c0_seq2:671-1879(-)